MNIHIRSQGTGSVCLGEGDIKIDGMIPSEAKAFLELIKEGGVMIGGELYRFFSSYYEPEFDCLVVTCVEG